MKTCRWQKQGVVGVMWNCWRHRHCRAGRDGHGLWAGHRQRRGNGHTLDSLDCVWQILFISYSRISLRRWVLETATVIVDRQDVSEHGVSVHGFNMVVKLTAHTCSPFMISNTQWGPGCTGRIFKC